MLIGIVCIVLLVMFGHNPVDQWKAEQEKYGRDPLVREINKYNEKAEKTPQNTQKYVPPAGATLYRLPPGQVYRPKPAGPTYTQGLPSNAPVTPPQEIPATQPGAAANKTGSYPSYMVTPKDNPYANANPYNQAPAATYNSPANQPVMVAPEPVQQHEPFKPAGM